MAIKRKPRKTAADRHSPPGAPAESHPPTTDQGQEQAPKRDALIVEHFPGDSNERAIARTILRPSVQAALTLKNIGRHRDETSIEALVDELSEQCKAASAGDLRRGEAMLVAQAHCLDALFNRLAVISMNNILTNVGVAETLMRLALRSQGQCRATHETLALMKNPPNVAFVKQANIGQAVQVNNGTAPHGAASRAGETKIEQTKLLEHSSGERLDFGASTAAGKADSAMAALEPLHRAKDGSR